jgi:hypothetical protein
MTDKLLTKKEAAELLRCTERTIDRYRARGIFKGVKFPGRVLFPLKHLMKACGKHMEN